MLTWKDNRWHCDGEGIHAGNGMEVRWPDGTWERVRIESTEGGQKLWAYFDYHGHTIAVRVDPNAYEPLDLRWPS